MAGLQEARRAAGRERVSLDHGRFVGRHHQVRRCDLAGRCERTRNLAPVRGPGPALSARRRHKVELLMGAGQRHDAQLVFVRAVVHGIAVVAGHGSIIPVNFIGATSHRQRECSGPATGRARSRRRGAPHTGFVRAAARPRPALQDVQEATSLPSPSPVGRAYPRHGLCVVARPTCTTCPGGGPGRALLRPQPHLARGPGRERLGLPVAGLLAAGRARRDALNARRGHGRERAARPGGGGGWQ